MEKTIVAKTINMVCLAIAIYLLTFFIFRSIMTIKMLIITSTTTTLFFCSLVGYKNSKQNKKLLTKASEKKHMQNVIKTFWQTNPVAVLHFFEQAIQKVESTAKIENDYIKTEKYIIFVQFEQEKTTNSFINQALGKAKTKNYNQIIIFTAENETKIPNNKNITIYNAENTYLFLKKIQLFPKISQFSTENGQKWWKTMWKTSNSKKFLFCAITFSIANFFVPQNIYYLSIAIICLIFSIICATNREKNPIVLPY